MMKKTLLLCALALSLVQCSTMQDEPRITVMDSPTEEAKPSNPYERTPEMALEAVQSMLLDTEMRSLGAGRSVDRLIDLADMQSLRNASSTDEFLEKFYAVEFKDGQGYAIVSKDLRTFPIYAILDTGRVEAKTFSSIEMELQKEKMLAGFKYEVKRFEHFEHETELRSKKEEKEKDKTPNSENATEEFKADGWRISRETGIRLVTHWSQHVSDNKLYMKKKGASYRDVYIRDTEPEEPDSFFWGTPKSFGCTPVAFGQVMYALRDEKGFRDLKYTSGEKVLWHEMSRNMKNLENQRFLGWLTVNCGGLRLGEETLVYNAEARMFLNYILGDYIHMRHDDCVVSYLDFDGYGWAEDEKVAEEFFRYPKCFVIMTASSALLNYINYHSFVIDGMIEFKKEMMGSGFLGMGFWRKKRNGIRHLYHVNAGWGGYSNGYYLYVQNVNDEYNYTGKTDVMDYRSKVTYAVIRPK